MVAGLAAFALLVAADNVADYGSNEAFVRHVLAMDTTFPQNALRWRAVTDPGLQTAAYWLIIAAEALTGVLFGVAASLMAARRRQGGAGVLERHARRVLARRAVADAVKPLIEVAEAAAAAAPLPADLAERVRARHKEEPELAWEDALEAELAEG